MELQAQWDKVNIKHVGIATDVASHQAKITVELGNHVAPVRVMPLYDYYVNVTVRSLFGKKKQFSMRQEAISKKRVFTIDLGPDAQLWDEFNPNLYLLTVEAGDDVYETTFGLRDISIEAQICNIFGSSVVPEKMGNRGLCPGLSSATHATPPTSSGSHERS